MTDDEKAAEAWAEALREIEDAIHRGTILSLVWLTEGSVEGRYHFGHYGYKPAREVVTRTLDTMRDCETDESSRKN